MTNVGGPKAAVVIPAYNAGPWIGRTISSVLDQAYDNLVTIVVDDGSSDNTLAEVQTFGDAIQWRTGPNRGACHARNVGFQAAVEAGAAYVLFLDADDYLEGDMIGGSVRVAEAEGADLIISNMHSEKPGLGRDERYRYSGNVPPEEFFSGWMQRNYVNPSALMWRASFFETTGGWDETLPRGQDVDITLRALLLRPRVHKNEDGAAVHARVNPGSISSNVSAAAFEGRLRSMLSLIDQIPGTSFEPATDLLCREVYRIALGAFRAGHRDTGRRAVAELAARGNRKHYGSRKQRLLATFLGLEGKERLRRAFGG